MVTIVIALPVVLFVAWRSPRWDGMLAREHNQKSALARYE